ncbi:MAG: hypothetical protein AB1726_15675 [Planctomycetota bacterium]
MIRPGRFSLLLLGTLLASAPAARGDKIHLTDGRVVADIRIVAETIAEVAYKKGNDPQTVPSEKILRVEYERFPRPIEEAETSLAEGDFPGAIQSYDEYVDGQIQNPTERQAWAPPYAAWRCVELRMEVANLDGAIERATLLIQHFPQSRYLPSAYLAKASAELQMNQPAKATATLADFFQLIQTSSLSKRWDLECRLAQIQADQASAGEDKREKLGDIIGEAGQDYPTVKSRARVVQGETYLIEAEAARSDAAKAAGLRSRARTVFEEIAANPGADDETLAGAYTGLGDCLFYEGWQGDEPAKLRQALLHYLRVVVNHEGQSRYVPKALFYAMRCFDLLQGSTPDEDQKKTYRTRRFEMKRELLRLYPDSVFAREAKKSS